MLRLEVTLVSVRVLVESDLEKDSAILKESMWPRIAALMMECAAHGDVELVVGGAVAVSAVRDDVFKFVQLKDRYAALASLLLKSRACHQDHEEQEEEQTRRAANPATDEANGDNGIGGGLTVRRSRKRALVRLPRTCHGRPYLPDPTSGAFRSPLNVSHQHPVVGIVRVARGAPWSPQASAALNVGLDVVMFDPYPSQIYRSASDFVLGAFREHLTPHELELLRSLFGDDINSALALREFYLHWAVKEAYVKALGVGLGYDFGSFHVLFGRFCHFFAPHDKAGTTTMTTTKDPPTLSYWKDIIHPSSSSPSSVETTIPATVHFWKENRNESWSVALRPIGRKEETSDPNRRRGNSDPRSDEANELLAEDGDDSDTVGCFCVFLGPRDERSEDASGRETTEHELHVDWLDLEDLIRFHSGDA